MSKEIDNISEWFKLTQLLDKEEGSLQPPRPKNLPDPVDEGLLLANLKTNGSCLEEKKLEERVTIRRRRFPSSCSTSRLPRRRSASSVSSSHRSGVFEWEEQQLWCAVGSGSSPRAIATLGAMRLAPVGLHEEEKTESQLRKPRA